MLQVPIPLPGLLMRLSSFFCSSVLRRYYTVQKLSDLFDIKVSSEPTGFTIICSELPRAKAWIEITNMSPFHIIVHEIEADFYLPDRVAKLVKICSVGIKAKATERIFIETDLTAKQVEYIRKHKRCQTAALKIQSLISCRLSSLEITDREIALKNIQFVNCAGPWRRLAN